MIITMNYTLIEPLCIHINKDVHVYTTVNCDVTVTMIKEFS